MYSINYVLQVDEVKRTLPLGDSFGLSLVECGDCNQDEEELKSPPGVKDVDFRFFFCELRPVNYGAL